MKRFKKYPIETLLCILLYTCGFVYIGQTSLLYLGIVVVILWANNLERKIEHNLFLDNIEQVIYEKYTMKYMKKL